MMSLACFLCGVYVEASVMAVSERDAPPKPFTHWRYDRTFYANPYGTIALGYQMEVRSVDVFVELRHQSALGTPHDLGEDSVRAGVRWYPWRGSRR